MARLWPPPLYLSSFVVWKPFVSDTYPQFLRYFPKIYHSKENCWWKNDNEPKTYNKFNEVALKDPFPALTFVVVF